MYSNECWWKKLELNAKNPGGWTHRLILNERLSGQLISFVLISVHHWQPVGHKFLLDFTENTYSSSTSWWSRTPTKLYSLKRFGMNNMSYIFFLPFFFFFFPFGYVWKPSSSETINSIHSIISFFLSSHGRGHCFL